MTLNTNRVAFQKGTVYTQVMEYEFKSLYYEYEYPEQMDGTFLPETGDVIQQRFSDWVSGECLGGWEPISVDVTTSIKGAITSAFVSFKRKV
jgi:hypothetical protein